MSVIDEKTRVPLFAVFTTVPALLGGIIWLTNIDAKATMAVEDSRSAKSILVDVRERVIRIEQQLKDQSHKE